MTWTCGYCGHPNLMSRSTCSRCGRARGGHHLRIGRYRIRK